ncbi:MAG: ABC transporter ATP-binding protein [Actinomycetota bacterium]|nr:ABC transporter ATP-binding protein [Actinomycetota bacterium]
MTSRPVLLEVSDLAVRFSGGVDALRGVSLSLDRGQSLAVVGESGSGKTTLALCLAGLIQPPDARGRVRVDGQDLLGAPAEVLRSLRWSTVALALQGAPFNPVTPIGAQLAEPLRDHLGIRGSQARRRVEELAATVRLEPALLDRHPHELSGGQRRRASLAMTLALDPALVVLDEPSAGLDPVSGRELVELVSGLGRERGFALVVLSHDLSLAATLADRTLVLYAGEAMEDGDTARVLRDPTHPYSWALLHAYPVMSTTKDLRPIRGLPPDPRAIPRGCPYHPRCTQAEAVCSQSRPPLEPSRGRLVACHFGGLKILLSAVAVRKSFGRAAQSVRALDGVSLEVREGEAVGVVGPSGSGKSTLARILCGHLRPDAGEVVLEGQPLPAPRRRQSRLERRRIQLVLQDPWDALSPRFTVEALLAEALDVVGAPDKDRRRTAVHAALGTVGLPSGEGFLQTRTHQLSGGQLQRIALARALLAEPKVLVADEPTAMLDPSEQARLLVVLRERQTEMGLGLVLVSHDLAVVRKVTDRIVVLDAGRVVEEGPSHLVGSTPKSLTARRLVEAAPTLAPTDVAADSADHAKEGRC